MEIIKYFQVQEEQFKDDDLQTVIQWLDTTERWPSQITKYQAFQRDMYIQGNMLIKREKLVIQLGLRIRAMSLAHRSHPGMFMMKNLLRQGLWWPSMDR